jgi:hypothetical protein
VGNIYELINEQENWGLFYREPRIVSRWVFGFTYDPNDFAKVQERKAQWSFKFNTRFPVLYQKFHDLFSYSNSSFDLITINQNLIDENMEINIDN